MQMFLQLSSATYVVLFSLLTFCLQAAAQGGEKPAEYGFEWISPDQEYLKVKTGGPGVYRITGEELAANGFSATIGSELSLLLVGKEVPIYASSEGAFNPADYIEFYVEENPLLAYQSEMFPGGESGMLSPKRALFSDTVVYFLTSSAGAHSRYTAESKPPSASVTSEASAYALSAGPVAQYWVAKGYNTYAAQYSSFRDGDGWSFAFTPDRTLTYRTPDYVDGGRGLLEFKTLTSAGNRSERIWELSVDGTSLVRDTLTDNQYSIYSKPLPTGTIAGKSVVIQSESISGRSNRVALSEFYLYYEADNSASSRTETVRYAIDPDASGLYALQWAGLTSSGKYRVYYIDKQRYQDLNSGNSDFSQFSGVKLGDKFVLTDATTTLSPKIEPVALKVPKLDGEVDYVIISSLQLSAWPVNPSDYLDFRSSSSGGDYRAELFYVEDLADIFGYGQLQDSRSIRNLVLWTNNIASVEHTFIIGKGREFTALRLPKDLEAAENQTAFVPTFGSPGSDNLLAVDPGTQRMVSAIGRIPVETSQELDVYLRKVRAAASAMSEPQTVERRAWMKQIVHLGGGANANEQANIKTRLQQMQRILENNRFGAQTYELYKNSDQPVQQVENDELFTRINEGASLITFFGHSSPGTFDFNIDDPERYENEGRYPFMISLGCYSGNMQTSAKSAGERFMLYEDKAAIAFGASVGLGYPSVLQRFASDFYEGFGDTYYRGTIGDALRAALQKSLSANSYLNKQLAEQFAFQGDPALSLYKHAGPDYTIPSADITVGPANLAYGIDSIQVGMDVVNIGSNVDGKLTVVIERETALRAREAVDTIYLGAPAARTRVTRSIDAWGRRGVGLNTIWATIIPDSTAELPSPAAEVNNSSDGFQFFIRDDGVDLLHPQDLALTDSTNQTFFASTRDPFGESQTVSWQLATDVDFTQIVGSKSDAGRGLLSWEPGDNLLPNTTYYWRAGLGPLDSLKSVPPRSFTTTTISSQRQRWGPRSLDQFRAGSNQGYFPDSSGNWAFRNAGFFMTLRTKMIESDNRPSFQQDFNSQGASIIPRGNQVPSIGFAIANGKTGEFIDREDPSLAGSSSDYNDFVFHYLVDTRERRRAVVNLLDSVVQDGDYVWVMSLYGARDTFNFDEWEADSLTAASETITAALTRAGAGLVETWTAGETVPYQFVYRKGYGVIREQVGASRSDVLTSDVFVELPGGRGKYVSSALPIATKYGNLSYELEVSSDSAEIAFSLIGTRIDGAADVLYVDSSSAGSFDLSDIDPLSYTALALEMSRSEPGEEGLLQAPVVTLSYSPRPELVYDPATRFERSSDTLASGAPLTLEVNVRNISPQEITDAQLAARIVSSNSAEVSGVDSLGAMGGWGSRIASINFAGSELPDSANVLFTLTAANQSEDVLENNIAFLSSYQSRDQTAPALRLLLDGDNPPPGVALVSDPVFEAQLSDDNVFEVLDEGSVTFSLRQESGEVLSGEKLPGEISFSPKPSGGKVQRSHFTYQPGKLDDGLYTLSVVARDQAANSTQAPAELRFEVVNETAVSNVLPYPNPFVDHVQFQYEATGVAPEDYQIDIYTSSGRLVKSLGPDDLGALKVGRQLTDGFWNAEDTYGQRLAKGVYLYRFSTRGDGVEVERRDTRIDSYVSGGFGKLVIL